MCRRIPNGQGVHQSTENISCFRQSPLLGLKNRRLHLFDLLRASTIAKMNWSFEKTTETFKQIVAIGAVYKRLCNFDAVSFHLGLNDKSN